MGNSNNPNKGLILGNADGLRLFGRFERFRYRLWMWRTRHLQAKPQHVVVPAVSAVTTIGSAAELTERPEKNNSEVDNG